MKKAKKNKHIDENDSDLVGFVNLINEQTKRDKNKTVKIIQELGDDLLNEIERKKRMREEDKNQMIDYILQQEKIKINQTKEELSQVYTYGDVLDIYKDVKRKNRTFKQKLVDFLTIK